MFDGIAEHEVAEREVAERDCSFTKLLLFLFFFFFLAELAFSFVSSSFVLILYLES